jgi:hypothetical protein
MVLVLRLSELITAYRKAGKVVCGLCLQCLVCFAIVVCPVRSHAEDAWRPPILTAGQQKTLDDFWQQQIRLGNSSIWLGQSDYKRFMEDGALPDMGFGISLRGEITTRDIQFVRKLLAPYLDKKYLTSHPKPRWYKPNPYDEGYIVTIESDGGDLFAAMTIGRMFRKARVHAVVGYSAGCMSSCVLLLAGAVNRTIFGAVGIHRPYSSDTQSVSFEAMQAVTEKVGADVSVYLHGMNIPASLYEAMTRVPPESIKILEFSDLKAFGLYDRDPVFAELNDNLEANLAHVSKSEFLSRKGMSERCQLEGYRRLKQGNNGTEPDMLEMARMTRECDEQTIYRDVREKEK